jgi:hypothetical protein
MMDDHAVSWSWPLFLVAVGLAWLVFKITE